MHTVGADLYQVVIQTTSGVHGQAELRVPTPKRDISVVQANRHEDYVAVHELAHNQGCRHENDTRGSGPHDDFVIHRHAKAWLQSINDTLLAATVVVTGGYPDRVLYFSNVIEDHPVLGPIGDAEEHNNALEMRLTACAVSNLRPHVPYVGGVDLSVQSDVAEYWYGRNVQFTALGGCQSPVQPIDFKWEMAVGTSAYVTVQQSSSYQLFYQVPVLQKGPKSVRLRLTATCSDGSIEVAHYVFYIVPPQHTVPTHFRNSSERGNELAASTSTISVAPDTGLNDLLRTGSNSSFELIVSDLLGRVVFRTRLSSEEVYQQRSWYDALPRNLPDRCVVSLIDANGNATHTLYTIRPQ